VEEEGGGGGAGDQKKKVVKKAIETKNHPGIQANRALVNKGEGGRSKFSD